LLRLERVSKIYPTGEVLRDVTWEVKAGDRIGLVGVNGAGKSTLIKIVAGIAQPTAGKLILYDKDGTPEEVSFGSTRDASKRGIGIVHQELNLFSDLDVAENVFTNKELTRFGSIHIDHATQASEARKVLKKLGQEINPSTRVRDLRLGQQQIVEIAKTMIDEPRILIMDEPTAALGPQETEMVGDLIKQLKSDGIGIFLISHDIHDVFELADRVTVMKNGQVVGSANTSDVTKDEVLGMIILGKCPHNAIPGPGALSSD